MVKKKKTTKKKTTSSFIPTVLDSFVGDVPFNPPVQEPTKVQETPPYQEPGVSFDGYSKQKVSEGSYQINIQERKLYTANITNVNIANPFTIARAIPLKNFYCTKIVLSSNCPMAVLVIYDKNSATGEQKLNLGFTAGQVIREQYLFEDVPLKFTGDIKLYSTGVWGAGDYLDITFYGWEE